MAETQPRGEDLDTARLWQRRLFEAVGGFWRWLVDERSGEYFDDWLKTQREMFAELPVEDDPAAWHKAFFRAQAAMERFIATRYGQPEMAAWTRESGHVFGQTAPDYGPGAAGLASRFARQADGYSSTYSLGDNTAERASITITHCGIWDYREQARATGVRLTLASPCTYCTRLTEANVGARGFHAVWSLAERPDGHGCHWEMVK